MRGGIRATRSGQFVCKINAVDGGGRSLGRTGLTRITRITGNFRDFRASETPQNAEYRRIYSGL